MKNIIICGFEKVGKTHIVNNPELDWLNSIELDKNEYDENYYPKNIIHSLEEKLNENFNFIFLPSDKKIRKRLKEDGYFYFLVYPDIMLENEYTRRNQNIPIKAFNKKVMSCRNENYEQCYHIRLVRPSASLATVIIDMYDNFSKYYEKHNII